MTNGANNNGGFNIANFRPQFMNECSEHFEDVIADYERSFVGSFAAALCNKYLPGKNFEVWCSISKFIGTLGYAMTKNNPKDFAKKMPKRQLSNNEEPELAVAKRMTLLGAGQFPEYVPISNLLDFYKALVEVN